jgi:hypothetical protein
MREKMTEMTASTVRGRRAASRARAASPQTDPARLDAVAAAALVVIRRAVVEGIPVTRSTLAEEAAFALDAPPTQALEHVDAEAQRLGVSSLR